MRVYCCPELRNFEIRLCAQGIGSLHLPLLLQKMKVQPLIKSRVCRARPLHFACICNEDLLLAVRSISCTDLAGSLKTE